MRSIAYLLVLIPVLLMSWHFVALDHWRFHIILDPVFPLTFYIARRLSCHVQHFSFNYILLLSNSQQKCCLCQKLSFILPACSIPLPLEFMFLNIHSVRISIVYLIRELRQRTVSEFKKYFFFKQISFIITGMTFNQSFLLFGNTDLVISRK